jgi:predicted Na+-dependent transporter
MIQTMGIPVLLGFTLAFFWPYAALDLGSYSLFLLMALMFATTLFVESRFSQIFRDFLSLEFFVGIFFCFFLIPSIFWLLSKFLFLEQALDYGIFWASLCPIALVAPQFTKNQRGDVNFSFSLMIGSAILFPLAAVAMNFLYFPHFARFQIVSQLRDIIFISTIPTILALVIQRVIPLQILSPTKKAVPYVNMLLIGLLSYIYMGAALQKLNLHLNSLLPLLTAFSLALLLDFGVYFTLPYLLKPLTISHERKIALRVSLSMKNVALSGGILLFEFPLSTLASSFVFGAHSMLFTYLGERWKFLFLPTQRNHP